MTPVSCHDALLFPKRLAELFRALLTRKLIELCSVSGTEAILPASRGLLLQIACNVISFSVFRIHERSPAKAKQPLRDGRLLFAQLAASNGN